MHILAANLNDNSNIDGLYVAVKDSTGTIIASGYTPLNVIITQSGSYEIDYTNYNNAYYFTNVYTTKPSIVTDYNAVSWGGFAKLSLNSNQSYTVTGRYLDQTNPRSYSKITVGSQYRGGGTLTGMYTALLPAGTNTPYTKGYTPYTVGMLSPNVYYDVVWNNYVPPPPQNPAYYQNATPSAGLSEIFDNKYN